MSFIPPSLTDILPLAEKDCLPSSEADKFINYYDSVGWYVGKKRMVRWKSAWAGWVIRWREQNRDGGCKSNMQKMLWNDELKRCIERMNTIRGQYGGHQDWDTKDKLEFQKLKARKAELMKLLGMVI